MRWFKRLVSLMRPVRLSDHATDEDLPADLPPPPDSAAWDEAAQTFQQERLASVQSSAETWNAAVTGLLGLFGTVAIVAGAEKISDVDSAWMRWLVVAIVFIAGATAGLSIWLGAQAQSTPDVRSKNWNGEAYRAWVNWASGVANDRLRAARNLGALSAILIFVSGLLTLIDAA